MSTDHDWQRWGEQDPYFGVLTSAEFRAESLTPASRAAFFETGFHHVACVMAACQRLLQAEFHPRRVLDFGCGVGRLVVPFARLAHHVVGVDVAPAMLAEAAQNCQAHGVANAELVLSDDTLSAVSGQFDLVHSVITLQHIPVARGLEILRHLLQRIAPGGVGAIHLTYGKAWHADTHGQPPVTSPPKAPQALLADTVSRFLRRGVTLETASSADGSAAASDPAMHMHAYPLSAVAYLLQRAGVRSFHTEFTDHGGELGVFLYFVVRAAPARHAAT